LISDLIDATLLTVLFLPALYAARYRIKPGDGKVPDLRPARKQLNDGSKARSAPAQRLLGRRMAFA
jgi:hypothetical protein